MAKKPDAPLFTNEDLASVAVAFLEYDASHLTAQVEAKSEPESDALARTAHLIGEDRETVRRYLADAIISVNPKLETRVRKVVKFSARLLSNGALIGESKANG